MSVPRINGVQLSDPNAGPLLLGCSIGTSGTALWSASAAFLGERFHIVAWDLPGHGRNAGTVSAGFTMAELASGVLAFADQVLTDREEPCGQLHTMRELATHVRAARRNGVSVNEIKEVLLQTAIYCGVPDANTTFRIAQAVLADEETPHQEDDR